MDTRRYTQDYRKKLETRSPVTSCLTYFSFIWIRHEVHRNIYKNTEKEEKERQAEKNSHTLKWLNYYIRGSRYQNTKPKVKVMYDSGTAGQPSLQ